MRIVSLITDFGLRDAYVGQLKGALLAACPDILPIDLSHEIPPWDVASAARCLADSFRFFPSGAIHLAVVDPGVGGDRKLVAASGSGHFFLGPDNGIFSCLLTENALETAHAVATPAGASPTFHGRDVLAPAAGRLAAGEPLAALGPALPLDELTLLEEAAAVPPDVSVIQGRILSVDHFGNLRTSFHLQRLGLDRTRIAALEIGRHRITTRVTSYHESPPGIPCLLTDSGGYVEIALNRDSAAAYLACSPGDAVVLHRTVSNQQLPAESVG